MNEIQNLHNIENRQNPTISARRKNTLPLFHVNSDSLENIGMGGLAAEGQKDEGKGVVEMTDTKEEMARKLMVNGGI